MSERMDARVRAGRRILGNAGHPARFLRGAGNPGCPFSWLLLFGQAKRSDSWPRRGAKAFDLDLDLEVDVDVGAANQPPRNGGSRSALQLQERAADVADHDPPYNS
jgi:hypothetical protein